jgi:hypothetical protein
LNNRASTEVIIIGKYYDKDERSMKNQDKLHRIT